MPKQEDPKAKDEAKEAPTLFATNNVFKPLK
jgi:hypothetical protein